MRAGSPVLSFAAVTVLALALAGCPAPNSPDTLDIPAVMGALTVLPGTDTPAVSLLLPQSVAFAVLGHSCGGIQEQAYATGFDPASGLPTGVVHIQTRCGGSGRGGGYKSTTYAAWVAATWSFGGNVVSSSQLAAGATVDPTLTATDAYGDSLHNVSAAAYLVVAAPAAPTGVTVTQAGDEFQVSWTPGNVNPAAVISSTLSAAPVNAAAAVLTAAVSGAAVTGLVGPLQPATTYRVTVVSSTIGGSGPASTAIEVTTVPASIPPSAPGGVTAKWATLNPASAIDTIIMTWNAAVPGDSPIDGYQVGVRGSDGAGTFTQKVPGTTLAASFTVDSVPDWSVAVRAHNAVGWGPWSAVYTLGGL
jgi:hypothetical protein